MDFHPEGLYETKDGFEVSELIRASENGTILESTVAVCDSNYDLWLDLGKIKGIIYKNDAALGVKQGNIKDIALGSRVGKKVCFKVKKITENAAGETVAVLSREMAQQECFKQISDMPYGSILKAKITHLDSFGAFCDIGCGIIALLPIDMISVSRISHSSDRFYNGRIINVVLKNIDNDGKITVSHKELLGTWEENAAKFKPGQTVSGVIRSIEEYGIFVELAPNLAGLAEPKENCKVGDIASVYIKNIIPEKMKVKLNIIDSFAGEINKNIEYFETEQPLKLWQYSPKYCAREIFSIF
ncbi:MAG: S1 RNA-binding domain-containing protein [Oscillospiraceae bacterium]|nr:S1 RNA-binding domain-containing protein [Candidatus Equicaccousia limihippi]